MTPTIRFQLEALFRKYDEKARAMYPAYARFPVPKLVFFQKGRRWPCRIRGEVDGFYQ